jgi:hypothetical protein
MAAAVNYGTSASFTAPRLDSYQPVSDLVLSVSGEVKPMEASGKNDSRHNTLLKFYHDHQRASADAR